MKRYLPMTKREIWKFISNRSIMALATCGHKDRPHNTPVWFLAERGRIYFRAHPYKMKVKNLLKNPYASCSFESGDLYTELRGVCIQAVAQEITNPKKAREIDAKLLKRYRTQRNYQEMPTIWREKYQLEPHVIFELTPKKMISWDNRKWQEISLRHKRNLV